MGTDEKSYRYVKGEGNFVLGWSNLAAARDSDVIEKNDE